MRLNRKKNKVQKEQTDNTKSIGHIDSYSCGHLRGWIKKSDSNDPTNFAILSNGEVVASGIANNYRQDLESAQVGNGRHGFDVELNASTFSEAEFQLELLDADSNFKVASNDFAVILIEKVRTISTEVSGAKYLAVLEAKEFSDMHGLEGDVLVDGAVVGRWSTEEKPQANQFLVIADILETYFDLVHHVFSLKVDTCDDICAESFQTLQPLSTPWDYLKSSYTGGYYSALNSVAAYRYESLIRQARRLDSESSPKGMQNISLAHDVIVEGYEKRKKFPVLEVPSHESPDVSIIIPAYNKFELTYNCIASIILAHNTATYEVILVDDCSSDKTKNADEFIKGITIVRNEENLRFLRSCNNGCQSARGKFISFLNNDTEVTSGWLDTQIAVFERFIDVGLVGSKLIYPDGRLQEAGGVVWNTGEPWNVGNGANAFAPEYNYTRQVDYVSGASMMIERSLWESLDGFSEEFTPAYYEDTDLAFKVRDEGKKVIYCPESTVIHFEGMSNGTNVNEGVKRFQNVNAPKFKQKWIKSYRDHRKTGDKIQLEKDRGVDYRVLVIDYATPDSNRDAGSYAAVQEMKLLQSLGFKVTFLPDNLAHMGKLTDFLQRNGIECLFHPFVGSIDSYIQSNSSDFDAIYITRYDIARKYIKGIRKHSNAKIVFNNADLHFLREIRAVNSSKSNDFTVPLETREKELAVMRSVDITLSYNDAEHAVIASHNIESNNVYKCPWVLYPKAAGKQISERTGIAFLGGYNHKPNVESVKYLAECVMPKLLERDSAIKLYIYGSGVSDEIEALACENIEVVGFVENLDDVYNHCRVFVAPLLSGAGIKGKVLESMSYGVPSVLSPIAAEGTGLTNGVSCLIAETDDEWVEQILSLYDDQTTWKRLAENSRYLTAVNYSFENGKKAFKKMLNAAEIYTLDKTNSLW